jgi:CheY-like chemotaxis protein
LVKNRFGGNLSCSSPYCLERGKGYKLIFMDISMPIMDGYQATQVIRQFEKNLVSSSYTSPINTSRHYINEHR